MGAAVCDNLLNKYYRLKAILFLLNEAYRTNYVINKFISDINFLCDVVKSVLINFIGNKGNKM